MEERFAQVSQIRRTVTDEFFRVAGFSRDNWFRKLVEPIGWAVAHKFAKIFADLDKDVAVSGLSKATHRFLQRYVKDVQILGQENVPQEGPLLIASNHPGTLDAFAIISSIPRDDMKIVVEGFPFFRSLTASSSHLIYTTQDPAGRMGALRGLIRHLQSGGGALIFPSGKLDPDPEVLPGASAALDTWSPSIELILKKVPQTQMIVTIVSGVLARSCVENPITKFFNDFWMKMRVAEFIQMLQQTYISRSFELIPKVTFGNPMTFDEIFQYVESSGVMMEIVERARQLLETHTEQIHLLLEGETMEMAS